MADVPPKRAIWVVAWRPTETGRVPPMATVRDSRGPCRLHETVIGQEETFIDAVPRHLDDGSAPQAVTRSPGPASHHRP
jgi:hypothetical protein